MRESMKMWRVSEKWIYEYLFIIYIPAYSEPRLFESMLFTFSAHET